MNTYNTNIYVFENSETKNDFYFFVENLLTDSNILKVFFLFPLTESNMYSILSNYYFLLVFLCDTRLFYKYYPKIPLGYNMILNDC